MKYLRKGLVAALTTALVLAPILTAAPAYAADNVTAKDAAGTTVTICSKDTTGTGVQAPCNILVDTGGTRVNPASSDNQTTGNTALAAIQATIGAISGGAWSGTGNATLDQIDQAIWTKLNTGITVNFGTLNGAATAANQTTGNTSLSSVAGGIGAQADGPCTSAASACSAEARLAKIEQASEDTTTPSPTVEKDSGGTDATDTTLHAVKTSNQASDSQPALKTISAADIGSTTVAGAGSVTLETGTPTANSAADFTVSGYATATLTVSGTFVGTINVEAAGSGGGATGLYAPANCSIRGVTLLTSQIAAPTVCTIPVGSLSNLRLRASAWTSGSATVKIDLAQVSGETKIASQPVVSGLASGAGVALPFSDHPVSIAVSTATTTLIVTGVTGKVTYVGAWGLTANTASTVQWVYGTGATCGTGQTSIYGAATWAAGGGAAPGIGIGSVLGPIPAGNNLCLITSGATPNVAGNLQYTQN